MYTLYTQYTKLEELRDWDQELASKIESSQDTRRMGRQQVKFYSDDVYNYGLREDGTVIRICKDDAVTRDSLREPRHETVK